MGALREDIQDDLRPVDDLHLREIRNGTNLGGRQLVIEDEQVGADLQGLDDHVGELSLAEEIPRVKLAPGAG